MKKRKSNLHSWFILSTKQAIFKIKDWYNQFQNQYSHKGPKSQIFANGISAYHEQYIDEESSEWRKFTLSESPRKRNRGEREVEIRIEFLSKDGTVSIARLNQILLLRLCGIPLCGILFCNNDIPHDFFSENLVCDLFRASRNFIFFSLLLWSSSTARNPGFWFIRDNFCGNPNNRRVTVSEDGWYHQSIHIIQVDRRALCMFEIEDNDRYALLQANDRT